MSSISVPVLCQLNSLKEEHGMREQLRRYYLAWMLGLYQPSSCAVMMSLILTTFIASTRAVAVMFPLHVIKSKKVFVALGLIALFLLLAEILQVATINMNYSSQHISPVHLSPQILFFAGPVFCMIIVVICSVVIIFALKRPDDSLGAAPGPATNNKRATIMVLQLSLTFVIISAFMLAYVFTVTPYINNKAIVDGAETTLDTFVMMGNSSCIATILVLSNSVANPLIYIARNAELNLYTRNLLKKTVEGASLKLINRSLNPSISSNS